MLGNALKTFPRAKNFGKFGSICFWSGRALLSFATGVLLTWICLASGPFVATTPIDRASLTANGDHAFMAPTRTAHGFYRHLGSSLLSGADTAVLDGGARLGPAEAAPADIRDNGHGRYSFWGDFLLLSTSDNSDPTINGRTLALRGPLAPRPRSSAGLVFCIALAAALILWGRRTVPSKPALLDRLLSARGVILGILTAAAPVAGTISIDSAFFSYASVWLVVAGLSAMLLATLPIRRTVDDGILSSIVLGAAEWLGVTCLLILAILTSGIVMARHQVVMTDVQLIGSNIYQYRIGNLPLGIGIAGAEPRTLSNKSVVTDQQGAFVPDHISTRMAIAPGRAFSWGRSVRFTFREPGGPMAPANALTITGSLRGGSAEAAGLLLIALLCLSARPIWRRNSSYSKLQSPTHELDAPRISAALGFALFSLGIFNSSTNGLPINASTMVYLSSSLRPTHVVMLTAAFLILCLLPWRLRRLARIRSGTGMILPSAFALLMSVIGLVDAWWFSGKPETISSASLQVFGSLQSSDAGMYITSALELPVSGQLDYWNSRRPLTAVLEALRVILASPDMAVFMLLGAAFLAIGLLLAAREIARLIGTMGAAVFIIACSAFVSEWIPTTMSEVTGCGIGLYALAALLFAWRRNSLSAFCLGILTLSIALTARSGPIFVVPLLVLAGALLQRPFGFRHALAWACAGLFAMIIGFLHSTYLVWALGGTSAGLQSNFSYVLYGLAVGGKGWAQILADHPELFSNGPLTAPEPQIYAYAIQEIRSNPTGFVATLLNELSRVPKFFWRDFFDLPVLNVWAFAGGIVAIWSAIVFRNRWGVFSTAIIFGLILSSPLILADGGQRVYAAAVPMVAFMSALGFVQLRWLFQHPLEFIAAPRTSWIAILTLRDHEKNTPSPLADVSMVGAAAVLCLIVIAPAIIRASTPTAIDISTAPTVCPLDQRTAVISTTTLDWFTVESDGQGSSAAPFRVHRSDFLRALEALDPKLRNAFAGLREPYVISYVVQSPLDLRLEGRPIIAVRPLSLSFDSQQPFLTACMVNFGDADPEVVGRMALFAIRSIHPITNRSSR